MLSVSKFPWKKDEKLFFEAMELRGTKNQYENWVIFNFGRDLGKNKKYDNIELIFRPPTGYPDAILVRLGDGVEILEALNIEFEEYSSDFKGHDPKKCDLIICAYDDWHEKYPNGKCPLPVYVVSNIRASREISYTK